MVDLKKNCKSCCIALTSENGVLVKENCYRNLCKKCRSKQVTTYNVGNPKRKAYMLKYARLKGIVKEYQCETCATLCYKKYARAFCSDKCRFMAYVDKQQECWIWTGAKNRKGYGKLCFGSSNHAIASRVSYELFKGPIENGLFICHTCDNPSCVNPDHLWAGSHVENMMDMVEKARQNHKLTPFQVIEIRKLWKEGWSQAKIIENFKITNGTLSNIIARRIWKHV